MPNSFIKKITYIYKFIKYSRQKEDLMLQLPKNYKEALLEELQDLVKYILSNKKFILNSEELNFKHDELISNNIIIVNESNIEISDYETVAFSVYNCLKDEFQFVAYESVSDLFEFLVKSRTYFTTHAYSQGKNEFFSHYFEIIIRESLKSKEYDFHSFILNISASEYNRNHYFFIEGYLKNLPLTNFDFELLNDLCEHIISLVNWFEYVIVAALRNYTLEKTNKARELLSQSLQYPNAVQAIQVGILQGLYLENNLFIEELKELVTDTANHQRVLKAITPLLGEKNKDDFKKFLEITETIQKNDVKESLLLLPHLYVNIINNSSPTDHSALIDRCFNKIEELLSSTDKDILYNTLGTLKYLEGSESEIDNLIIRLIQRTPYDENLVKLISDIYGSKPNIDSFFDFLQTLAHSHPLSFKAELLRSSLDNIRKIDNQSFDLKLAILLTNDKGQVRFVGCRLLTHLLSNSNDSFTFDILTLDPLSQYKFLLSSLQMLLDFTNLLPILLPLHKSPNDFVREAFACKIEELTRIGFGKDIIELASTSLPQDTIEGKVFLARINECYTKHSNLIQEQLKLKEIDPFYTQAKLFENFNNVHYKRFNKTFSEGLKANSIMMQLVNNIILAKGGGWKMENQEEIRQLGKFESSFSIPKSLYLSPELNDWERLEFFNEDWEGKFNNIIRFF